MNPLLLPRLGALIQDRNHVFSAPSHDTIEFERARLIQYSPSFIVTLRFSFVLLARALPPH